MDERASWAVASGEMFAAAAAGVNLATVQQLP